MTAIRDLDGIEVEHLLGEKAGPLVKVRCLSNKTILLAMMTPAAARQIAAHLTEAAARAEYEADLYRTATTGGMDEQTIGGILYMVRLGEQDRHTNQGDTQ